MQRPSPTYEQSSGLNLFSSRYDLYLKGVEDFTEQELLGLKLFQANCVVCHPDQEVGGQDPALFTSFVYYNPGKKDSRHPKSIFHQSNPFNDRFQATVSMVKWRKRSGD